MWEYKVFAFGMYDLEKILNDFGKVGWEVVTLMCPPTGQFKAVMKRKVSDSRSTHTLNGRAFSESTTI